MRKSRSVTNDVTDKRKSHKSPIKQGVWELRGRSNGKAVMLYKRTNSSLSEICSVRHQEVDQTQDNESVVSPNNSMAHGDIVIFDDIGDEWQEDERMENDRIQEALKNAADVYNPDPIESERVAKVIGSLPIAVYEGSPRRYGPRQVETSTHPQLPSAQSLLASPSNYPPRPGFPQRVLCTSEDESIIDSNHFTVRLENLFVWAGFTKKFFRNLKRLHRHQLYRLLLRQHLITYTNFLRPEKY